LRQADQKLIGTLSELPLCIDKGLTIWLCMKWMDGQWLLLPSLIPIGRRAFYFRGNTAHAMVYRHQQP